MCSKWLKYTVCIVKFAKYLLSLMCGPSTLCGNGTEMVWKILTCGQLCLHVSSVLL